jgi:hypothetical protein
VIGGDFCGDVRYPEEVFFVKFRVRARVRARVRVRVRG